ncbi:MAG TPA: phage holin family protein [Vicinamibacterales bacterium]|nr:phage holin family protein [Vicinamibacterales bacterium]
MAAIVITWIANSLAIYFVAWLLGGVEVGSLRDAFIAGAVLSVINAIVKPVIVILTLPLTLVTLGLFYFVVTAFCLWLASQLVAGFIIHGFVTTVVAAILISICSAILASFLTPPTHVSRGRFER